MLSSKDHWLTRCPGQGSCLILHQYQVVLLAPHFRGELIRDVLQQRLQFVFQGTQVRTCSPPDSSFQAPANTLCTGE